MAKAHHQHEKNRKKKNLAEKTAILQKVTPFDILTPEELNEIAQKTTFQNFSKGTYLFKQGEASRETLFILVAGSVKITVFQEDGEEITIGRRYPYEFSGVTTILTDEDYPVSVAAEEDLKCLLVPHEDLEQLINRNVEFASYFTYELSTRLRGIYESFMEEARDGLSLGTHPLRKRVSELMVASPVTCGYLDSVEKVAQIMAENDVSSIVVMAPNGSPLGIITEKDLVSKVLAEEGPASLKMKAHQVMSTNIISVSPEDFSIQAQMLMLQHSIKHVLVCRNGTMVGILTIRDLLRTKQAGALSIINQIENQERVEDLQNAVKEIDHILKDLIMERAYASEICPLITEFYDRLTRKIISLAEKEMIAEGYGEPPVEYSWINMGSSGRREQFSRTDQDNGIIFESLADDNLREKARDYFLVLGEKIVGGLEKCGFKRCPGKVMANNREWCRPLSEWKQVVSRWVDDLDPDHIRKITIFLDFRHIWGHNSLTSDLKNYVANTFKNAPTTLMYLARDTLRYKPPLNIFRQIITEKSGEHKNQVNLKVAAAVRIVDCIRLICLKEAIQETSTFHRLQELRKRGVLSAEEADFTETAYETVMMFRIREAVEKINQGKTPSNSINPYKLSKKEQSLLKQSFIVVNRLQNITSKIFRVEG